MKEKYNTYQCNRSACKKADKPSIMSRMATVRTPKKEKTMVRRKKPPKLLEERPTRITMDHSTSDSSEQEEEKISVLHCIIFLVERIGESYKR